MHVFFSGIGGTAIGPLALIAKQAGFSISGSDKQDSQYIDYLRRHDITNIHIGQERNWIDRVHQQEPINWYVYSSAIAMENPGAPELAYCQEQDIKTSKRDELINLILQEKALKLVAVAGTHGKTTTTAMVTWLFKQLELPVSYSVGAKISFGDMGQFQAGSKYFVLECDEFDRNFLAYEPYMSLITGVTWDHHEIFPTREDYLQAFQEFIDQSQWTILWDEDYSYLGLQPNANFSVLDSGDYNIQEIRLAGQYNRLDGWLAIQAVHEVTKTPLPELLKHLNRFPGLQRRMEQVAPGLFSDYAHTPEKVRGAMSTALEMAIKKKQAVIVVYEPLTNRRQHYMLGDYHDCFAGAAKVYWLSSYLAREDPNQRVIPPEELISHLSDPTIAEPLERDDKLKKVIQSHLENGDMVVCMAGGGGGSLDEWIRERFTS